MRIIIIDGSEIEKAKYQLMMAMWGAVFIPLDIAHADAPPDEPVDARHAKLLIVKNVIETAYQMVESIEQNEYDHDQRNKRDWTRNIHANVPRGYPVKNAPFFRIWMPRRYITKRAVVAMRTRKNDF
jgi:hypothetical protein